MTRGSYGKCILKFCRISNKNCQTSIENSQITRKNIQISTKLAKFIAIAMIVKFQAKTAKYSLLKTIKR